MGYAGEIQAEASHGTEPPQHGDIQPCSGRRAAPGRAGEGTGTACEDLAPPEQGF